MSLQSSNPKIGQVNTLPSCPRNKRLFVFSDGTKQDGLLSWEVAEDNETLVSLAQPPSVETLASSSPNRYASNVFRLSRCIAQKADDGTPQIVLYQSGVGVPTDFEGEESTKIAIITGLAVASKIRDAYNFIVQNYAPGDEIYLFGFSRGAYTARKLAGLLDKFGLLDKQQMSKFFEYWKLLLNGKLKPSADGSKLGMPVNVKFLGVWDTVGYIKSGIFSSPLQNLLGFPDNGLPDCVLRACHAIAFHETRYPMLCTPFAPEGDHKRLAQVWFPGVHTDVGGGYKEHQIADISLLWMSGELKNSNVKLDEEYLETRLSLGKKELEVHQGPWLGVKDGTRLKLLEPMKGHPSTYYHRSLWGSFHYMNQSSKKALEKLTGSLVLDTKKMAPFSKIEERFWAPRWARYIPDPTKDHGGLPYNPFPEDLPVPHDAPLEEESPDVLFEFV